MNHNYLAYDLEIGKTLPEGETDWHAHAPLGITCAAVAEMSDNGIAIKTWHGIPQMSKEQCREMVNGLIAAVRVGYTLVGWNSLSFDWRVTAEESGMFDECRQLALNHVDPMFHIFCLRGHPLGLDTAAKGMGLAGKVEGLSGSLAPILWHDGQYDTVLRYVEQDVRTTLEVALAIERYKHIRWTSKAGRLNTVPVDRLLTVREALELDEPDTSWMTGERLTRSRFTEWMTANQPG